MISAEDKQKLIVGFKQVKKTASQGACAKIFIAMDCSESISEGIRQLGGSAELVEIPTMRELGELCGIDVAASCAAIKR